MTKPAATLKLDWCSHAAAKYAVEHWHYSESLPASKIVKCGVWEDDRFIGCVLFSRGANMHIGAPYGLNQNEACELTRIALTNHLTPVSRITAQAIRMLKKQSPGLRLIISYADPMQNHVGGIYQAGNWVYVGKTKAQSAVVVDGRITHKRSAYSLYGTYKGLEKSDVLWKHKYLYPLDNAMRRQIEPLRKPYPKRAGSETIDTPADHAGKGGAAPTPALHLSSDAA
jgi:hypothetical protein